MRILHVLDHSVPVQTGYSFRSLALLRNQRALGWETAHVTSAKHEAPWTDAVETVEGLEFHRTADSNAPWATWPVVEYAEIVGGLERKIESLLPSVRPDILHAHSPVLCGMAALRVGRRHGIPVVYEMRASWEDAAVNHGTTTEGSLRYRASRALETRVLRRADAITTIALGLKGDIASRGIPEERITLVPNAVDVEHFPEHPPRDAALAESLGIRDGEPVLSFIGSFYEYEGLGLLLDAFPAIVAAHPDVRVLLVGGEYQEDALRDRVRSMADGDRIVFTGRVPHDDVPKYYGLADVMVYPRLPIRLTELVTPLKPLEAMAQRRIVVASDVGGHRELIADGETGVLFRAGDAGALADAVTTTLSDRARWPAMLNAGRRFVEEERTWAAVAARYRPVYEALA